MRLANIVSSLLHAAASAVPFQGRARATDSAPRVRRHSQLPEIDAACVELDLTPVAAAAPDDDTDSGAGAPAAPTDVRLAGQSPGAIPGKMQRLSPAVSRLPEPVLIDGPGPEAQAVRLRGWIADSEDPPAEMLASEVLGAYSDMCTELGWRMRPWNPIAKHLCTMTGGKRYCWVTDETGRQHRRRIYRFRTAADEVPRPLSFVPVRAPALGHGRALQAAA